MLRVALLALGLLVLTAPARADGPVAGTVTLRELKNARGENTYVLNVDGLFASPMANQMRNLLASLPNPRQNLLVIFNSPGGFQSEGGEMINLLRAEKARGRFVETSVENGSTCASMCVPVFLQGQNRYAGEGSLFMFHGASQPLYTNVPDFLATEQMVQIMVDAGLDANWINARRDEGVFTSPGAYWISGKELFDANARAITTLIPRHVKEAAWTRPIEGPIRRL